MNSFSSHSRAAGLAAGEDAAAEERAFERAVAMHAAAAKTAGFADGVEPPDDLAILAEYAGIEIGLKTAERLAGEDVEPHSDQRPGLRVQDLVRRRGAGQPLAARAAGVPDGHDLQVLGERVVHLPVARDDLALQVGQFEERLRGQLVHSRHQLRQRPGYHEVGAVLFEGLHRAGRARQRALEDLADVLAGEVRVLL